MTFFWQNPQSSNPFKSPLTEKTLADYKAEVKGSGEFGGEQPYVPYFYDTMLHGVGPEEEDSDGDGWVGIFTVEDADRKLFPELKNGQEIAIFERSDGLVMEVSPKAARKMLEEMEEGRRTMVRMGR